MLLRGRNYVMHVEGTKWYPERKEKHSFQFKTRISDSEDPAQLKGIEPGEVPN
jgi:hypothetical protein